MAETLSEKAEKVRMQRSRELAALPDGAAVEILDGETWIDAVVVMVSRRFGMDGVDVRPSSPFPDGRKRPLRRYAFEYRTDMARIRLPQRRTGGELAQANVFADWLEDNDYPEAGRALRAAFPLTEKA